MGLAKFVNNQKSAGYLPWWKWQKFDKIHVHGCIDTNFSASKCKSRSRLHRHQFQWLKKHMLTYVHKKTETPRNTRAESQEESQPQSGKKPAGEGDRFGKQTMQRDQGEERKGEKRVRSARKTKPRRTSRKGRGKKGHPLKSSKFRKLNFALFVRDWSSSFWYKKIEDRYIVI